MHELILKQPLFSRLSPVVIERLLAERQLYPARYDKGSTVYNQKDRCLTLDFVLSGSLVAYSLSENGSAMIIFEFLPQQVLGANLLFGESSDYPFTIYCHEDADVLHVTKAAVEICLQNQHFTMEFIKLLSYNSQKLNRRVTMATQKTLRENLLEYLRQQTALQRSNRIILPISKKQLADYLGVRRPSLFRELKALKDEKMITIANRTITLLDTPKGGCS